MSESEPKVEQVEADAPKAEKIEENKAEAEKIKADYILEVKVFYPIENPNLIVF